MNNVFKARISFRYPISTLFSRLHAQLTDVIYTFIIMVGELFLFGQAMLKRKVGIPVCPFLYFHASDRFPY